MPIIDSVISRSSFGKNHVHIVKTPYRYTLSRIACLSIADEAKGSTR